MVRLTAPPAGVQDRLVYDYLYQLQEYLAVALDRARDQGASAGAERAAGTVSAELARQVEHLKALIIKTAHTVESHTQIDLSALRALIESLGDVIEGEGGLRATLLAIRSDYVAQSDYGSFSEAVSQQLEATAAGLTQYVDYVSRLQADLDAVSADFSAWAVQSRGYIRSGIVGWREDTTPIVGIAIGQNLTVLQDAQGGDVTVEIDGVGYQVVEQKGFRAIYAADELSFWQDDVKVAYMGNRQLVITDVAALSGLRVGSWQIRDDSVNGLVIRWED